MARTRRQHHPPSREDPLHRFLLLLLTGTVVACGGHLAGPGAPSPKRTLPDDPVALLHSLTLHEKIAQLVMPWTPSAYAAEDDPLFARAHTWTDSLGVGGMITSGGSPMDVAARLAALQRGARIPLLLAADLESGAAFRFIGATPFPTNMGVAATGRPADAYVMGEVTAAEARALGIRVIFAPVADVNSNPDNPIINTRSFGADAAQVGALVAEEVRGLEQHGVLAVVKHFPGHGDTDVDSHLALPSLRADWARLSAMELVPFRSAITAGVTGIMSAHIALPGVDAGASRPGTLSPVVLGGMLRDSLRFTGLAVTDALDMAGVVNAFGADEAPVLALLAGADLLLQPVDPVAAVASLERAVAAGRITEARIDRSVLRILQLKYRLGLISAAPVRLDSVMAIVGRGEHLAVARDITRRAMVLVQDAYGTVDSLRARRRTVGLVVFADDANPSTGAAMARRLRARGDTVRYLRLHPASGPASYDSARVILTAQPGSIVALAVRPSAGRGALTLPAPLAELMDSLASERPLAVVSLGSPYVFRQLPHVTSIVQAGTPNLLTEEAAADVLVDAEVTGTLPIPIPPRFPIGAGLRRAAIPGAP